MLATCFVYKVIDEKNDDIEGFECRVALKLVELSL
jgi:hypothetical protein